MSSFPAANFNFNGAFIAASTIAALRAMPAKASRAKGDTAFVNGALELGDGSGGSYCWVPNSLDNDDGQTTIKPFDMPDDQPGRWRWTTNGNANGVRIDALELAVNDPDHGLLKLKASITEVDQVRLQGDQALAQQTTALATSVTGSIAALSSSIDTRITSLTNADAAMVTKTDQLRADYNSHQTAITNAQAALTSEATARANGDAAQATATTNLQTSLQGQINTTNSRITTEVQSLSNADSAAAVRLENLEAGITGGTEALSARIDTSNQARIDGDNALATSVSNLNTRTGNVETSVGTNAAAIATINGKMNATYGVTLQAGSNKASLKGYANNDTAGWVFDANEFYILNGANRPFSVVGNQIKMTNVEVDTLKVNTAAVPVRAAGSAEIQGTYYSGGSGNNVTPITRLSVSLVMPIAGWIEVTSSLKQDFRDGNSDRPWKAQITVNGSALTESIVHGTVPGDSIFSQGAIYVAAGTYTIALQHDCHYTVYLQGRSLFAKGFPYT